MLYNTESTSYCYHCLEIIAPSQEICPFCNRRIHDTTTNERALPPGTILSNKYFLGEIIGEGGFGITYKGIDLNLHLKVAIKEYFPSSFASRSISTATDCSVHIIGGTTKSLYYKGLEDYTKEANRLAKFADLPGIVSVLNFFYENNTAYMVMEFVDGITLKDYLKLHNDRLPWRDTLDLLHPVILSLKEIHKAGIIHRDISPDNIMISKNNEMVLIDFGAARNINQVQQDKTVILKKGFAPPEQYQTNGDQGSWSDIYSFCATIYRIICGHKPPDALEITAGTVRFIPLKTLIKDIPDSISMAIQQGLQPDISVRIKTMDELERYLYQGRHVRKKVNGKKLNKLLFITCCTVFIMISISFIIIFIQKYRTLPETAILNEQITEPDEADEDRNKLSAGHGNIVIDDAKPENDTAVSESASDDVDEHNSEDKYEMLADTTELSYEDTGDGIAITAVAPSVTNIVIPGDIDGQPVKELIGLNTNATTIVIKNGTEKISAGCFRNCVYLESLYIPASVTTIEPDMFANCLSLKEIVVSPDNPAFYSDNNKLYTKDGELIFG